MDSSEWTVTHTHNHKIQSTDEIIQSILYIFGRIVPYLPLSSNAFNILNDQFYCHWRSFTFFLLRKIALFKKYLGAQGCGFKISNPFGIANFG